MKRSLVLLIVVAALTVTALFVWRWLQPSAPVAKPLDESANISGEVVSKETAAPTKIVEPTRNQSPSDSNTGSSTAVVEKPLYEMTKTTSSFDPVADAKRKETLPFRMFASGGTGKIVDAAGNVIIQSDSGNAIFSCEVSPDQTRISINRGSGKYDIVTPSTGETIRLPQQPPGENVLGFSWRWINDQTLIGVSGITVPFRDGQVGPEREEPIISHSILYVYDLKERKLSEVQLPPTLQTKTFSVSAVDATGKLQLQSEDRGVSNSDASLGWFEVRAKK
jgi:hypothetical protein